MPTSVELLRQCVVALQVICGRIESGRARMPVSDYCRELRSRLDRVVVDTVAVLCAGHAEAAFREHLLAAGVLSISRIHRSSGDDSLNLPNADEAGLRIVFIGPVLDTAELSHAVAAAALLVLVHGGGEVLAPEDAALLQTAEQFDFVLPVMAAAEAASTSSAFWNALSARALAMLPVETLDRAIPVLAELCNRTSERGQVIAQVQLLRRTERALNLLKEEIRKERYMQSCVVDADGFSAYRAASELSRDATGESVRSAIREVRDGLSKYVEEVIRRGSREQSQESGILRQIVAASISGISADAFDRTDSRKSIILTLKESERQRIEDSLQSQMQRRERQTESAFLRWLGESDPARRHPALFREASLTASLEVFSPDERRLLQGYLRPTSRYKGELPKRNWMARIGEGRRNLLVLIMSLSLFGGMLGLPGYRQKSSMGILLILFFIGAVIHTYFSWRKEDAFLLEKEREKLKEQLDVDLHRVLGEYERERLTLYQGFAARRIAELERQGGRILESLAEERRRAVEVLREAGLARKAAARREIDGLDKLNVELDKVQKTLLSARQELQRLMEREAWRVVR